MWPIMIEDDARMRVRNFLSRQFRDHGLKDDDDIFGMGFVNSLFAAQLVMFIEKEFEVTVENEDLDLENFKSVNALIGMIGRKGAFRCIS
jgi:methoxymalonate biosynthesis acyl carrier protein